MVKKMKKKNIFVITLCLFVIGYFLGMFVPIKNIIPVISENRTEISAYEWHVLVVNWVLAFVTLLTVFVALFKEEIIKLFRHPKLLLVKDNESCLKEALSEMEQGRKIATEFYYTVRIENTGNVEARNIDILIISLNYSNNVIEKAIPINDRHIKLNDSNLEKLLAPSMVTETTIFSIAKEMLSQNVTNGQTDYHDNTCVLKIGNNNIPKDYYQGTISLLFQIYCDGGYKDNRLIKIKWDGIWEDRLEDIKKNHISIEEV